MPYVALTQAADIRTAFDAFSKEVKRGGREFDRSVGYQGGGEEAKVYWHEELGLWVLLDTVHNRYWCCFGTQDPTHADNLSISCEINPPLSGTNSMDTIA